MPNYYGMCIGGPMAGQLKAWDKDSFDGARYNAAKPAANDTASYNYFTMPFRYWFLPFPSHNSKDGFWVVDSSPRTVEHITEVLMENYIIAQTLLRKRAGRGNEIPLAG